MYLIVTVIVLFFLFSDPEGRYTLVDFLDESNERKPIYVPPDDYLSKWSQERDDPLKFVPSVTVKKFQRQGNEWLYGWTIRGSGVINQREDLEVSGDRLRNYVHEAIHTDDEYETRRLTEWIMETMFPVRERYQRSLQKYRR